MHIFIAHFSQHKSQHCRHVTSSIFDMSFIYTETTYVKVKILNPRVTILQKSSETLESSNASTRFHLALCNKRSKRRNFSYQASDASIIMQPHFSNHCSNIERNLSWNEITGTIAKHYYSKAWIGNETWRSHGMEFFSIFVHAL